MNDAGFIQQLNSVTGMISLAVAILVAWLNNKIRADLSALKLDMVNREKVILGELTNIFLRKPELIDDYPLSRREFENHKQEDRAQHQEMDALIERHHMRFRAIESQIAHMEASKEDRPGFGAFPRAPRD